VDGVPPAFGAGVRSPREADVGALPFCEAVEESVLSFLPISLMAISSGIACPPSLITQLFTYLYPFHPCHIRTDVNSSIKPLIRYPAAISVIHVTGMAFDLMIVYTDMEP
jgi:hypothetical protein